MTYSLSGKRVWVAGHNGMVGSAVCRRLATEGCSIITVERSEVDLRRQSEVEKWMAANRPDVVVIAAAKVGGILANDSLPADFLYENLIIEANVIHTSKLVDVQKLLFLGSSCIYPKFADQPIKEEALLTAPLEPTNQWYALAKISGVKMCEAYRLQYDCDFISAMPTNLYGIGDNFDLKTSHVVPALIRKIERAVRQGQDTVTIWGSGKALRDFLYVDDLADACVLLLKSYSAASHINVGSGSEVSIIELAELIADILGYRGAFDFDASRPDGTPRKILDVQRLDDLGWTPKIGLRDGLGIVCDWYRKNFSDHEHDQSDGRSRRVDQDG